MENNKSSNAVLCIISFFVPIIGWILYFAKRDDSKEVANTYATWAWLGFGISFVLGFIGGLIGG